MEMDNLDDDEVAGIDSMAPMTYVSECTRAALQPHLRENFTDNGMVTFASEYILANFDASQQVWKKVGGHARGSHFTVPFGPPIDPIDSFHVTLVWPLLLLFQLPPMRRILQPLLNPILLPFVNLKSKLI